MRVAVEKLLVKYDKSYKLHTLNIKQTRHQIDTNDNEYINIII